MNAFKLALLLALTAAPAHGMLMVTSKTASATAKIITYAARQLSTTTQKKEDREPLKYPPYLGFMSGFLGVNGVEEPEEIRQTREEQSAEIKEILIQLKELKAAVEDIKAKMASEETVKKLYLKTAWDVAVALKRDESTKSAQSN